MAQTNRGIKYPSDYDVDADIPEDMKALAESADDAIGSAASEIQQYSDGRYALITEAGNKVALEIDQSTFKIKIKLYNKNNTLIHTSNEIDLPLESVVVNAEYDSTNKEIVLTLQNGNTVSFSVSDLIVGLVSSDDFDTAMEDIQRQLSEKAKQIDVERNTEAIEVLQAKNAELEEEIRDLEDNQIPGQATGTEIYISDSAKAKNRSIGLTGRSTQESTTGKNLFNVSKEYEVIGYNTIPIDLMADEDYIISASKIITEGSTNTMLIGLQNEDNTITYMYSYGIDNLVLPFKPNKNIKNILLYSQNSYSASKEVKTTFYNLMIRPASITDDTYEPYTGGEASPNPNYEQPIKSAGDNGSINEKVQNKNFFDIEKAVERFENWVGDSRSDWGTYENGVVNIVKSNGAHGYYGFAGQKFAFNKGASCTLSAEVLLEGTNSASGVRIGVEEREKDNTSIGSAKNIDIAKNKWTHITIIVSFTEAVTNARVQIEAANTGNTVQIKNIQLEPGTTASPYVEHKEQDYSIFVQQPFRSIGDVRDCFVKKSDGKLYERHYIGEVVLNGTEEIYLYNDNGNRAVFYINVSDLYDYTNSAETPELLSNRFRPVSQTATWEPGRIACRIGGRAIFFIFETGTTVNDFKNWLSTHNVVVQYKLAEPLDLPCTEEQKEAWKEWQKARTYKGGTHISSEDETPANVDIEYVVDTKAYIDNLETRIERLESEV